MFESRPPFEAQKTNDTYQKISMVDISYPAFVSEGAKDLISKVNLIINRMEYISQIAIIIIIIPVPLK